jgi:hypothetical protein
MLALLVLIRDVLLAAALAWVGVTVEQRSNHGESCAGDACQVQRDR